MPTFRRKADELQAVQWQPGLKLEEQPEWFRQALEERQLMVRENGRLILAAGSEHQVRPGDWVTLDEDGISSISDPVFKRLYDPA